MSNPAAHVKPGGQLTCVLRPMRRYACTPYGTKALMAQAVEALGRRSQPGFISTHVVGGSYGGRATVESHGPQLANGGHATVESHGPQMANGGHATVASHGPQMANGGRCTVESPGPQMANGGRCNVESHGPQMANGGLVGGYATGRPAGRRKDGKKKKPKRCLACVKAGRDPECYSCKGRGNPECPHLSRTVRSWATIG